MDTSKNKIKTKYFVGATSKTEWSSVYYYSPQIPATYAEKGEIFAVISLAGPTSFDSDKAGNLLLDRLHELYFESKEDSTLIALEKATLGTKKLLLELLQNDELTSTQGIDLDVGVCVVGGNYLYVVMMGGPKVFGFRNNQIIDFDEATKDPDGFGEIKVCSLKTQSDDRYILLSPQASKELEENIEKELGGFNLDILKGRYLKKESLTSAIMFGVDVKEEIDAVENENIEEERDETETIVENSAKKVEEIEVSQNEVYEEDILEDEGESRSASKFIKEEEREVRNVQSNIKNLKLAEIKDKISNTFEKVRNSENGKTYIVLFEKFTEAVREKSSKVGKFIWNDLLQMNNTNSKMYMRGVNQQTNWRPIVFIGVIILLISYFTFSTYKAKKEQKALELEAQNQYTQIENQKNAIDNEVRTLINTYDREDEKQQLYSQISVLYNQIDQIKYFEEKKAPLKEQLSKIENKLLRKIVVNDPEIIKDFGIVENISPTDIDATNDSVYISDGNGGAIYSFNSNGGDLKKVGEGLTKPKSLSVSSDGEILFLDSDSERVMGSINIATGATKRYPGLTNTRMGEVNQIDAYMVTDGDNRAYVTRVSTKELIQLRKAGDNYGLPDLRLSVPDANKLLDVEVNDGRIYLISEGQGIRRYLVQREFENNFRGFISNAGLNNVNCMTVDSKYIYLGDTLGKRIVVMTKFRGDDSTIMDYVAEYDLSSFMTNESILDIAVPQDRKGIFVLVGTKVVNLEPDLLQPFAY